MTGFSPNPEWKQAFAKLVIMSACLAQSSSPHTRGPEVLLRADTLTGFCMYMILLGIIYNNLSSFYAY